MQRNTIMTLAPNHSYQIFPYNAKNGSKMIFSNYHDLMMYIKKEKEDEENQQFNAFLQELGSEFTEEEIEFIKANWTPPK